MTYCRQIIRWTRLLTTTRDNRTPDCIRIGGILLGTQFLMLAAWSVIILKQPFDALNYGGGAAAILAAIGAALRLKAPTDAEKAE